MTNRKLYTCGVNHFLVCDCGAVLGTAYMVDNQVQCGFCPKVWTFRLLGPAGELTADSCAIDSVPLIGHRHGIREPVIRIDGDAA